MAGLYLSIRDDVLGLWNDSWSHLDVPVFWRSDDLDPLPDPSDAPHFLRNEIDFGYETLLAFGGGPGANEKAQFGSVVFHIFTARDVVSENVTLELLHDAVAAFRSKRIGGSYGAGAELSFIGDGSGFNQQPTEDGNWSLRGTLIVFQYRFSG